ncbi:hypothetical protein AMS68_003063 [Peltaster fructicola]|uniref:Uncharacterized protein n=1 Tax=Peltaster fructicola TaxID=286661 RepID=A0A6H0XS79_9PEZI|nr:hypothetical protein AMS68_003063 [Peltaster fructicola]
MTLKRKRSSAAISPASDISASTTTSSPLSSYYTFSRPVEAQPHKTAWIASDDVQLGCRTLKRHRDNRPNPEQIYAYTIGRLFNAQRERPNAEPQPPPLVVQPQGKTTQKTSLHSFWSIPQPLPARHTPEPSYVTGQYDQRCEDCDGRLKQEDAMDVDDAGEVSTSCHSCLRNVCDTCAVQGDQRVCLSCAI